MCILTNQHERDCPRHSYRQVCYQPTACDLHAGKYSYIPLLCSLTCCDMADETGRCKVAHREHVKTRYENAGRNVQRDTLHFIPPLQLSPRRFLHATRSHVRHEATCYDAFSIVSSGLGLNMPWSGRQDKAKL